MLLAELPTYRARIEVPCDVVERRTGRDDRVSVEIDVDIPLDADRQLPFAARFGSAWPISRMIYGPTGRYDSLDVDYINAGSDLFAPSHILSERHLTEVSVAFGPGGLHLASYRAFQDWAKLVGARDLNLDWEHPHSTTGRAIRYTPDKSAAVSLDEAFRGRYAFDGSFDERVRRIVRDNFVMRPGGIWMRMPLPVWRLHDGHIGLDPFPRGAGAQTASFALDRLEDLEAMVRATTGRRAEATIGGRTAEIHFLDPEVAQAQRDDLAVLCRTDIPHAVRAAAPLLPSMDGEIVAAWHSIAGRTGPDTRDGRADMARTFLGVCRGVAASVATGERDAWLSRTAILAARLETIELTRLARGFEALPSPRAA
jgi:hypothetical protein